MAEDDLTRIAKRIETLFAATQVGQTDAYAAWMETAAMLIPLFAELRRRREDHPWDDIRPQGPEVSWDDLVGPYPKEKT